MISAEEQEKMKSDGLDLDTEFGRLTNSFLQRLLNKYRHRVDTQTGGASQVGNGWPTKTPQRINVASRAKSADRGATSEREDKQEYSRLQSLRRSNTTSWKRFRRHNNENSVSALNAGKTRSSIICSSESNAPNQFGRSHTIPVSMMESKSL